MFLVTPTYNRFAECVNMIESANKGTLKPSAVYVWDNSGNGGFVEYVKANDITLENTTAIFTPQNMGCARAWNSLLKLCYDQDPTQYVVVSNDDITFEPDTLELFDKATRERPDSVIYCAGGIASPNAFSLFVTRYDRLVDTVGLFDPMYLYPYCEDGDMYVRLRNAGYDLDRVEGASADHIGSATLKAFDATETELHHMRFARNAEYFFLKWNISHNEIHTKKSYAMPFNGSEEDEALVKSYMRNKYGA